MEKEQRDKLRETVGIYDNLEHRIRIAKQSLELIGKYPDNELGIAHDLFQDRLVTNEERTAANNALRPVIAEMLERDIKKIQELRVSG